MRIHPEKNKSKLYFSILNKINIKTNRDKNAFCGYTKKNANEEIIPNKNPFLPDIFTENKLKYKTKLIINNLCIDGS